MQYQFSGWGNCLISLVWLVSLSGCNSTPNPAPVNHGTLQKIQCDTGSLTASRTSRASCLMALANHPFTGISVATGYGITNVRQYQDGQLHGYSFQYFTDNKHMLASDWYQAGIRQGEHRQYHTNGQVSSITHYSKGTDDWLKIFDNAGVISKFRRYQNGDPLTGQLEYISYEKGLNMAHYFLVDGEKRFRRSEYFAGGNPKIIKEFRERDLKLLIYSSYYPNGQLQTRWQHKPDGSYSKMTSFWQNGHPQAIEQYTYVLRKLPFNNERMVKALQGEQKLFCEENGLVKQLSHYLQGKKHGLTETFDCQGNTLSRQYFEMDKPLSTLPE